MSVFLLLLVTEASPPRLPVSEVSFPLLLVPEVPALSIQVPVSVRYRTLRLPVRLGCRYCYGNLYAHYNPRWNPSQRPKMLPVRLLLRVPRAGTLCPGECLNCCLRPGMRFLASGVSPQPLSGPRWKTIDPLGFLPPLAGKYPASVAFPQVVLLNL